MIVQYAIPSVTPWIHRLRTYCTALDKKSIQSHLCTICDPIRCTICLAQRYGHIALSHHQIFHFLKPKHGITEVIITSLYGVVTVNQ